jgi:threonine synthase
VIKSKLKIGILKDEKKEGIWRYGAYLSPLPENCQLTLGEGGTAEIAFEKELVLKREDENPTGSLKDRGMAYLISWAKSLGKEKAVLSSSGNAAIAAAEYCRLGGISLTVFVSPKIEAGKLAKLREKGVEIITSERPISEAVKFSRREGVLNLRPSKSKFGPEGYQTIAFELAEGQGMIEDIFIPVSSGVALTGIAEGFKKLGFLPRLHVCQPAAVCPLASFFTKDFQPEESSLAQALVAKYTPLKQRVISLVKESGGTGWVISNKEIQTAGEDLSEKGIITSAEGALAYAAWKKAEANGWPVGKAACLLTGKKH